MPWLPIELIKDNSALIYDSDILTIIDPREELIYYYNQNVSHSQELNDGSVVEQLLEDEDEEDLEEKAEELLEILKERRKSNLH